MADGEFSGLVVTAGEVRVVGTRLGLGLAAAGRPAYITSARAEDLGEPAERTIDAMHVRTHLLLDSAWANGIRYIDVARSYGLAETFLGTWLAKHPDRRSELIIGSKWGYVYVGDWRFDVAVHEVKDHSVAMFQTQWPETVRALGHTQPDVYLIHSVTPESPALRDVPLLDRLRELAAAGVRVGISTSGPSQAQVISAAMAVPDCPFRAVQATWNLLEQSAAGALQQAHAAKWLVVVKEVLANGRLTDPGAPAPVRDFARSINHGVTDLAIGAALEQSWADIVLTGAVTPQQIETNTSISIPSPISGTIGTLAMSPTNYWQLRSKLRWS